METEAAADIIEDSFTATTIATSTVTDEPTERRSHLGFSAEAETRAWSVV